MTPRVTIMIIGVSVFLLTDTLIISAVDTPVPKTNDELLSQTKEESDSKHIEGTGYQTDKQDKILTSQSTKQVVSDSCMDMDKEFDKTGHIERKKYQGSDKEIHITNVDIEADGDIHTADEVIVEFPKLTRIDPGKVGNVVEVELEDGQFYKRITRSVDPPIFEIPNYLTMKETRFIISAALNNGMVKSEIVGEDINEFFNNVDDIAEIPRVSEQTWVSHEDMPRKISERLRKRLQNLLQLPEIFFEHSELMQVVSYVKKGHYHAHLDTSDTAAVGHLPCCFQVPECLEKILDPVDLESCCRICRYATVLYFLNDVDEGGETAFPLADTTDLELEV
ncbi:prolyl 4-hydroxylase [Mactra antiquata]